MILEELNNLTTHHLKNSLLYKKYVNTFFENDQGQTLSDVPFLPVRAFKEFDLKSILDEDVFKIMRSSGTGGKQSQIFLDKETAQLQTNTLISLFGDCFGKGRFPMLILDSASSIKDRNKFSARTAAINGFSFFSRGRCFAFDDDFNIQFEEIEKFLSEHKDKKIFIFGFTFIVWQFLQELAKKPDHSINLENSFILHGGGWKKLENQKVTNEAFKSLVKKTINCNSVHNYYGMVEQTGTIFFECEHGRMHGSRYSDIITRDINSHEPLEEGETGLIQVFSVIQKSYPGHSLLTEDVGRFYSGDKCSCGRKETIIEIHVIKFIHDI